MPVDNTQHLYHIEPLVPLVEQGTVLLTPNYRLARRLKNEWDAMRAAAGDRVWAPLQVYPLEAWLQQRWEEAVARRLLPPRVPLSSGQVRELWQRAIEQEQDASGQYSLLHPTAAAALAQQARETLLRWEVDLSDTATRQGFELDPDCASFLRWCDRFCSHLAQGELQTPVEGIRQLLDCGTQLPRSRVALLEFDDIPPLFRSCLDALCETITEVEPQPPTARLRACAFADKRSELAAAARWARELNTDQPGATVGIVLHDMVGDKPALEYLLRREFDCLGRDYTSLPVNFSAGITLDRAPVVRDAMRILRLGLSTVPLPEIVALLGSRFVMMPDASSASCVQLITRLHETGRESLAVGDVRYMARQTSLGQHLLAMSQLRELRQAALPSAWVERICRVLDIWGWPGSGSLDSLEYQQVGLWYATLEAFAGYDMVVSHLSLAEALQLLQRCLAEQVSQPQTPEVAVQVLGSLEAAGLAFDHLWLCGMQGNSWPAPAKPNPFIPLSLQRDRDMPHATAAREWAFAAGLIAQYQRSVGTLTASFAQHIDGVPELPSALLDAFEWYEPESVSVVSDRWQEQWQARDIEVLSDTLAPPVTAAEGDSLGGGSALLEDQSNCPFRAFARRRLRTEPLGESTVAMSPADRGSILHKSLFVLFGLIGDSAALQGMDDTDRRDAADQAVQAALQELPAAGPNSMSLAWRELEAGRLRELLLEWLAVETQRGDFVVDQREQAISLDLEQLQIELRIDRVDRLPDGAPVIIDYKSGRCSANDWLGERPARPQLLLYGIAAPQTAAALAFAQVRSRDCRYVGLGRNGPGKAMDEQEWLALNDQWRQQLQRLAQEFVQGDARVDPLPNSCTWCGLQPLCRVGQAAAQ